jgi:hypothetical protein
MTDCSSAASFGAGYPDLDSVLERLVEKHLANNAKR